MESQDKNHDCCGFVNANLTNLIANTACLWPLGREDITSGTFVWVATLLTIL